MVAAGRSLHSLTESIAANEARLGKDARTALTSSALQEGTRGGEERREDSPDERSAQRGWEDGQEGEGLLSDLLAATPVAKIVMIGSFASGKGRGKRRGARASA